MSEYDIDSQPIKPTDKGGDQPNLVAQALEMYSVDEKGKVVIPEGTPDFVVTALNTEKRRRDVNSSFGKSQTDNNRLTAENDALKAEMAKLVKPEGFSVEQAAELETLRYSDVDAWYEKKREFETKNSKVVSSVVDEAISAAKATATVQVDQQATVSRDEAIAAMLTAHNAANPEHPITTDMLALNVPPILVKQFASGDLDAPGFMAQVSKFIYADRVVKKEATLDQPNLSKAAHSQAPSDSAKTQSMESLYAGI